MLQLLLDHIAVLRT